MERIRGPVGAHIRTLEALLQSLATFGVELDQRGGVRLVPASARDAGPSPTAGEDPLHRIIYRSTMELSRTGSIKAMLDDIDRVSRHHNEADKITGALVVRDGLFLAALEGPSGAVHRRFAAICADPRHGDIVQLDTRHVVSRHFSGWALCCGVLPSDAPFLAREPAVKDGFSPERLTPASAVGLLSLFRDMQARSPRIARTSIRRCPLDRTCRDATCATG